MRFIGKLSRDKRGIGSLVGAVFLILILGTGFALYILNQRTAEHYDQTLQEMNELDYDRSREKIVIKEAVVTDADKLNVTVKNEGPISSHLILLGVYNETLPPQYYELDQQVNPAETETDIGLTEMGDGAVFEGNQYTIQVITELGNIAVYSYPPEEEEQYATISDVTQIVVSNMTAMVGPVLMDYESFQWYSNPSAGGTGNSGTWEVGAYNTALEWSIVLTNHGEQEIYLSDHSQFAIISFVQMQMFAWYIKEEYTLPVGQPAEITFCWTEPSNGQWFQSDIDELCKYHDTGTCATFLMLLGDYADGSHYGQNLAYDSVKVYKG